MAKFVPVEPFDIVIFGVTGDLSKLKLLPALFHRFLDGQIDSSSKIIGVSRQSLDKNEFIALAHDACQKQKKDMGDDKWNAFSQLLEYVEMDATQNGPEWQTLLKNYISADNNRPCIFYLAVMTYMFLSAR